MESAYKVIGYKGRPLIRAGFPGTKSNLTFILWKKSAYKGSESGYKVSFFKISSKMQYFLGKMAIFGLKIDQINPQNSFHVLLRAFKNTTLVKNPPN